MKRFLMLSVALLCVCGAKAQSEETITWPLEPKNEYVEYMLYLESEDIRMMGDKGIDTEKAQMLMGVVDYDTPEQLLADVNALYVDVEARWRKFVWLCNEDRFKEAIELYRDDPLMIDLALSHTMIRYTFHYDVLGFIAYDTLAEDEARRLMANALSLDCSLLGYHYVATGDESYLEYYDEAYHLLKGIYLALEDYQAALDLINSRAECMAHELVTAGARGSLCVSKAEMYFAMGDAKMAYDLLVEGKRLYEEERLTNDDEALIEVIEALDGLIEYTSQYL